MSSSMLENTTNEEVVLITVFSHHKLDQNSIRPQLFIQITLRDQNRPFTVAVLLLLFIMCIRKGPDTTFKVQQQD